MPAFTCRQYYTIKCVHRPICDSTSGLSVICNEAVAVFVQAKPDVALAALHIGKRRFSWAECTSLAFLFPQRLMVETILSGVVIWVSLNLPFLFGGACASSDGLPLMRFPAATRPLAIFAWKILSGMVLEVPWSSFWCLRYSNHALETAMMIVCSQMYKYQRRDLTVGLYRAHNMSSLSTPPMYML